MRWVLAKTLLASFWLSLFSVANCAAEEPEPNFVEPACVTCGMASSHSCGCGPHGGGVGGAGYGIPGCIPLLETTPGWNLFWDSCLTHWPNCGYIDPMMMSNSPTWYASAEFVPLHRNARGSQVFATQAGVPVLGTGNFDADFNSGVKLTLGTQLGEWYRIEGSYLGNYSWSDTVTVLDLLGGLEPPFTVGGIPLPPAFNNSSVQIGFASHFHSAELNLRRKIALPTTAFAASWLIGGRYTRIQEQFNYRSQSTLIVPGVVTEVGVATDNQLLGLQMGLLGQWLERDRMWVDFEIKGSINRNLASQNTVGNLGIGPIVGPLPPRGAQEERTAFSGDILLAYNYQFTPSLTFRAGYQATWITGVALAAENFQTDLPLLALGPAAVDHGGDIVYHGPTVGLVWVY